MSGSAPDAFEAAGEGTPAEATRVQCALCGLRFTHGGRACAGCALGAGCDLVKCPGCGYQFPRGSRLVSWWRRVLWRG